jgi:hypothetical protein
VVDASPGLREGYSIARIYAGHDARFARLSKSDPDGTFYSSNMNIATAPIDRPTWIAFGLSSMSSS